MIFVEDGGLKLLKLKLILFWLLDIDEIVEKERCLVCFLFDFGGVGGVESVVVGCFVLDKFKVKGWVSYDFIGGVVGFGVSIEILDIFDVVGDIVKLIVRVLFFVVIYIL